MTGQQVDRWGATVSTRRSKEREPSHCMRHFGDASEAMLITSRFISVAGHTSESGLPRGETRRTQCSGAARFGLAVDLARNPHS